MQQRIFEWLEETAPLQKIAIVGVMMCILGVGFFMSTLEPAFRHLEQLSQSTDELERRMTQKRKQIRELNVLKATVRELDVRLRTRKESLGLNIELDQVLKSLSQEAQRLNVSIIRWKPGSLEKNAVLEVGQTPVSLQVKGEFHQLGLFLNGMGHLPKVLQVEKFRMFGPSEKSAASGIRVELELLVFSSLHVIKRDSLVSSFEKEELFLHHA